jgi:hypothetical protein
MVVDVARAERELAKARERQAKAEACLAELAQEVERLQEVKRPRALEAVTGDSKSKQALNLVNSRLMKLLLDQEDAKVAIEQAAVEVQAAELALRDSKASQYADQLEELKAQWVKAAQEADAAAKELEAAFTAADGAATEIARIVQMSGRWAQYNDFALATPGAKYRALHHAGLRRHIRELGHPLADPRFITPFADVMRNAHLDEVIADLRGDDGAQDETGEAA